MCQLKLLKIYRKEYLKNIRKYQEFGYTFDNTC